MIGRRRRKSHSFVFKNFLAIAYVAFFGKVIGKGRGDDVNEDWGGKGDVT